MERWRLPDFVIGGQFLFPIFLFGWGFVMMFVSPVDDNLKNAFVFHSYSCLTLAALLGAFPTSNPPGSQETWSLYFIIFSVFLEYPSFPSFFYFSLSSSIHHVDVCTSTHFLP